MARKYGRGKRKFPLRGKQVEFRLHRNEITKTLALSIASVLRKKYYVRVRKEKRDVSDRASVFSVWIRRK